MSHVSYICPCTHPPTYTLIYMSIYLSLWWLNYGLCNKDTYCSFYKPRFTVTVWQSITITLACMCRHGAVIVMLMGAASAHSSTENWLIIYTNFIFLGCILLRNVHLRIFQTYARNRNWEFDWCYYISLYHNMFRALRAILRWIQLVFKTSSRKPSLSQRIRCS
jgi:hypothetical protein